MVHTSLPSSLAASEVINGTADENEMTPSLDFAQCHETFPLKSVNGNYINPENFPIPDSRPGSAAAMYSPGPPTRTTGSTASSSSTTTTATTAASGSTAMKRKKSRPQLHLSDEDSDGADADAEYASGNNSAGAGSAAWGNVNIDSGRRRGLPKRSAASAAVAALEDIRRHSMIV